MTLRIIFSCLKPGGLAHLTIDLLNLVGGQASNPFGNEIWSYNGLEKSRSISPLDKLTTNN